MSAHVVYVSHRASGEVRLDMLTGIAVRGCAGTDLSRPPIERLSNGCVVVRVLVQRGLLLHVIL